METEVHEETVRDVVSWRRAQLARSGFSLPLASGLARDGRYDLHALLELGRTAAVDELEQRMEVVAAVPCETRCERKREARPGKLRTAP